MHDLTPEQLQSLHGQITRRRGPSAADEVIKLIRAMLNHAQRRGLITDNPASAIPLNGVRHRMRFLDADEQRRFWAALDAHHDQQRADIIRLLVLTGKRKFEVIDAERSEFSQHGDSFLWVIPSHRNKQDREHVSPISRAAMAIVRRQPQNHPTRVFARPGGRSMGNLWRTWKAVLDQAGIEDFRIHDLRHWSAALIAENGGTLFDVMVNHGHTDVKTTRRYLPLFPGTLGSALDRVADAIGHKE